MLGLVAAIAAVGCGDAIQECQTTAQMLGWVIVSCGSAGNVYRSVCAGCKCRRGRTQRMRAPENQACCPPHQ